MNIEKYRKTLSIIHGAICLSLIVGLVFAYFSSNDVPLEINTSDIFIYLVPIAAMIGYFSSTAVYQNQIQKLSQTKELPQKLQGYFKSSIVKYALLEAPALIAIYAYYTTGIILHLVIAISLIVFLIFQRPTLKKLKLELHFQ